MNAASIVQKLWNFGNACICIDLSTLLPWRDSGFDRRALGACRRDEGAGLLSAPE